MKTLVLPDAADSTKKGSAMHAAISQERVLNQV